MTTLPFSLAMPNKRTTPVVFASPHSGRNYPRAFRQASVLDRFALRSSEDAFVDLLFDGAPLFGAPFLCAMLPRAYIDLNRGVDELDASLIKDIPAKITNPRVSSGLGVIPRVVSEGRQIYRGKIPLAEAKNRIDTCWHPYHEQLGKLLQESHAMFGKAILIDCHSMPHEAIRALGYKQSARPDIVLGDRFGAASDTQIVDKVEELFVQAGLRVNRNKPFAGAHIAHTYGRPSRNQHVIQIEVDRSLYMNEAELRPNDGFRALKSTLNQVIGGIVEIGNSGMKLAAE